MKILILLLFCNIISIPLQARWEPEVRLTNDSSASNTAMHRGRSIAANNNYLYMIWDDARDGNREIYYKRSADNGTTWGDDTRLTNDTAVSRNPMVAVSGSNVHIIWDDSRDGNREIYYKRSTDNGSTWGDDIRLSIDTSTSWAPFIAVSGDDIHVAWPDNRNGSIGNIYYRNSTDNGKTWNQEMPLTSGPDGSYNVSMCSSGPNVHIAWNFNNYVDHSEIYYIRSADNGKTWSDRLKLSGYDTYQYYPSVAAEGDDVMVVYQIYYSYMRWEIYFRQSSDNGKTWGEEKRLTDANDVSTESSIALSDKNVHIAWSDNRSGTYDIFYKNSSDKGFTWSDDMLLSDNHSTKSRRPTVEVSDSVIHVVWTDKRDSPAGDIYYRRNPNGNLTSVDDIDHLTNKGLLLYQNYPNPFSDFTDIEFYISRPGPVRLTIFDVRGNEVASPLNRSLSPGRYRLRFDAGKLTPGIYFYRIGADGQSIIKSMTLIR